MDQNWGLHSWRTGALSQVPHSSGPGCQLGTAKMVSAKAVPRSSSSHKALTRVGFPEG